MNRNLKYAYVGLAIVLAVVGFAIFAPHIMPYDPNFEDAHNWVLDPPPPQPFSAIHPLGTDIYNRDILTRLAFGARYTLWLGLGVALVRLVIGLLGGFVVAYGPKFAERVVNWLYVLGSGLPPLIIYFVIFQRLPQWDWADHGLSLIGFVVVLLAAVESPRVMITVRGRVEQLMHEPYYEGAVAVGNTPLGAFRRHILPNLWTTLSALAASETARSLLVIGGLGLLGVQVTGTRQHVVPAFGPGFSSLFPEWSSILADNIWVVREHPWVPLIPATGIMILVLGFGLLARGAEPLYLRLRRRWGQFIHWLDDRGVTLWRRLAVLAVAALVWAVWHYQGLPWGQAKAIRVLVFEEQLALAHKDLPGLGALVDKTADTFRVEQQHFVERVIPGLTGMPALDVDKVQINGHDATATVTTYLPTKDGPKKVQRQAHFVRRWGTWYDTGYDGYTFQSLHTRIVSSFSLMDRKPQDVVVRDTVEQAVGQLDKVMIHLQENFPGIMPKGVVPVTLFPSHQAFLDSLGLVPENAEELKLWWAPGESLRLTPNFLKTENFQHLAADFDEAFSKLLAVQRGPTATPALIVGLGTGLDQIAAYRANFADNWVGQFKRLPALLNMSGTDFMSQGAKVRTMQAVQLTGWLQEKGLTRQQLVEVALMNPILAEKRVAELLQMSVPDLEAAYASQLTSFVSSMSLLDNPAFRARFPTKVLQEAVLTDSYVAASLGWYPSGNRVLKIDAVNSNSGKAGAYNVTALVRYTLPTFGGPVMQIEGVEVWALVVQPDGSLKFDPAKSALLTPR